MTAVRTHIGLRIWCRRQALGIDRNALADRLALAHAEMRDIEMGVAECSMLRLVTIAAALGVQPTWFFEGHEDGTRH